ncbi:hemerythrin [Thermodesulfobium acidiphilum]|uniref:Hemerythrin n=1 Tax=Thermodesulfobium acidiphilum TaxID=1794699 RepID=A0A2R4W2D6_THEAF|nr:bacteriohemerythrin [Thermodesulfobium acidiphilum]AWB10914.1 hemerythrin [Thermodesulfobium acidiphilum]
MPLVQWSDDLSSGFKEIGDQHKELINRVNKLLDACNPGKGKQEIGETLNFLSDYVVEHFNSEEKYMKQYNYPGLNEQIEQHKYFVSYVGELKKDFEQNGPSISLTMKLSKNLVDWLVNHIMKVDKKAGAFLKEKVR